MLNAVKRNCDLLLKDSLNDDFRPNIALKNNIIILLTVLYTYIYIHIRIPKFMLDNTNCY